MCKGCYNTDAAIEQADWDSSKVREKLRRDIDAHVTSVRTTKLSELTSLYEVWCKCNKPFSCTRRINSFSIVNLSFLF